MTEPQREALTLWYDRPAEEWVEALPVGNGRLGAMIFGGAEVERLALNDDTLWSGGPRDWDNPRACDALPEVRRLIAAGDYPAADALCRQMMGPYTQSYMPLGDLRLRVDSVGQPEGYRRELDLTTAIAAVSYRVGGVTFTREVFVSAPDNALVVRLTADAPGRISLTAALGSQLCHSVAVGPRQLQMRGVCPSYVAPDYYNVERPVVYAEGDGSGMAFAARLAAVAEGGTVTVTGEGLRVEGADAVTLLLATATGFAGFDRAPGASGRDPDAVAGAQIAALSRSYAELRARHVADHAALFGRVSLDLGETEATLLPTDRRLRGWSQAGDPQLITLLFQYGRYLLIASSRPGSQAANLQGIWSESLRPPWSSNYTLNINTEMNYWPAEVANLAECHRPLFDMVAELSVTGARTARVNYGCGGWVAHHNSDLWRQSAPAGEFGHGDPVWSIWPMGGAWLCRHLWEHYLFGGDEAFLRERAYPLMRGAALFCLDWLVEDGQGHLITAPSTSPENTFAGPGGRAAVSAASTMDMAITWDLLTSCIAASQILGADEELRARMQGARRRLLALQVGRLGQLQEWAGDWDDPEDHHRHVSHLFGLHPGSQIIGPGSVGGAASPAEKYPFDTDLSGGAGASDAAPALRAAARRSLELRGDEGTGWSMAWKVSLWARLGDGDRAARILGTVLRLVGEREVAMAGGGVYASLLCAHPPFQIDGNLGATAGVAEMLLQSHAGEIQLLPALPAAWPRGSVRGLRARGGFTLDIAWDDGRLTEATVRSARGGRCWLRHGDERVALETEVGGSYVVRPA